MSASISQETWGIREDGSFGAITVWVHEIPELGEVTIVTNNEKWHLSLDQKGRLGIRCSNLPHAPVNRVFISTISSNLIALETRNLGE